MLLEVVLLTTHLFARILRMPLGLTVYVLWSHTLLFGFLARIFYLNLVQINIKFLQVLNDVLNWEHLALLWSKKEDSLLDLLQYLFVIILL